LIFLKFHQIKHLLNKNKQFYALNKNGGTAFFNLNLLKKVMKSVRVQKAKK